MKKIYFQLLVVVMFVFTSGAAFAFDAVTITSPMSGSTVSSPVTVCMETWGGVEVQAAKKGVNDGKGHHHLLIDEALPGDLSKPVGKDATHVHMGDGSSCKTLKLSAGKHSIRSLFAKGNHVPYNPALTDVIHITVK
jgi:hypothetical protein